MRSSDVKLLQKCLLFKGLTEIEVDKLIEISEIKHFSKGKPVFQEGDISRDAYLILEGSLGVRKHVIDNNNVTLSPVISEHKAGEVVGEFSFFDAQPRSAEVFAMVDTLTLVVNPQSFKLYANKFTEASQQIMENMIKILIGRIRKSNIKLSIALEWGWRAHDFDKL